MKSATYTLEFITPCFCSGADKLKAEVRAPSIRGQLRWWFRTLGGFSVLSASSVAEQERLIFGSAAGAGAASKLRIQVKIFGAASQTHIGRDQVSFAKKYFLWPLAQGHGENTRAAWNAGTRFELRIHWLGDPSLWPSIQALISVFGQIGSLGTRSRRAMGALAFAAPSPHAYPAMLSFFLRPSDIVVKQLSGPCFLNSDAAVGALAAWLQGWRQHGRTIEHRAPPHAPGNPGFDFAMRDHHEGAQVLSGAYPGPSITSHTPAGIAGETFRAALGLPIAQRFTGNGTVNWTLNAPNGDGRFASPVILRPYRMSPTDWRALVIFVDAHQWPSGQMVDLDGTPRAVSLDLYNEMKRQTPTPFP